MKKLSLFLVLIMAMSAFLCACGKANEPHEAISVSAEIAAKFPEYCGLDESEGLTVYVWQMAQGSYSFGLLAGESQTHTHSEIWNLKTARAEEMTEILASYSLPRRQIEIVPFQHPFSSYIPKIWVYDAEGKVLSEAEDYIEDLREMLNID